MSKGKEAVSGAGACKVDEFQGKVLEKKLE